MNLEQRTQHFLVQAKAIHGDMYDYSHVKYVNSSTKVDILCGYCGQVFKQTPNSHTRVNNPCGCPHCRYIRMDKVKPSTTLTTEQFIRDARMIHHDVYDYDCVEYTNSGTKVDIKCNSHGIFTQLPGNHKRGQGCPKCELENKRERNKASRLTIEEYIARCNTIYNMKYDYSRSEYRGSDKPITIRCHTHGDFMIGRAEKHLTGQSCPRCTSYMSTKEHIISSWLEKEEIEFEFQKKFEGCVSPVGRSLSFDFYLPRTNTIIEYDGEHHFMPIVLFNTHSSLENIQLYDRIKTEYAAANGMQLIRIKYTDASIISTILDRLLLH